jgi:hypothetical protein
MTKNRISLKNRGALAPIKSGRITLMAGSNKIPVVLPVRNNIIKKGVVDRLLALPANTKQNNEVHKGPPFPPKNLLRKPGSGAFANPIGFGLLPAEDSNYINVAKNVKEEETPQVIKRKTKKPTPFELKLMRSKVRLQSKLIKDKKKK